MNPEGLTSKHKARLVGKGFQQLLGIDFDETFSHVLKTTTLRFVLIVVVTFD